MSIKRAFLDGARAALSAHGIGPKEEEPSMLRKALPWLAAGGAGLAGYKLLRTPTFSANPALRKLQQQASSKGFHRIVDVTHDAADSGLLRPMANPDGKMSPWNKLKFFLNEGTNEAIPITRGVDANKVVGRKGPLNVKGVTHGRWDSHGTADVVRGGTDIEGPQATQHVMNRVSKGGKRFEANLLQKYAPNAIPTTHTNLADLFEGLPQERYEAVKELQSRVMSNYGPNTMLKPNQGLASGGRFPHSGGDWATQLKAYDDHFANPEMKKLFDGMHAEGGNEMSKHLIDHGIYEGQVLHDALRKPKSIIGQQRIDNPMGEYRVHTMAGSAPSELVVPRFAKGVKGKMTSVPKFVGKHDEMRKFVEQEVLNKLPEKYRSGNYAFDVMPHKKPDGSVGYKILEMNPTEQATATSAGGGSGFLDPSSTPFTGHLHYRAATGRHTPLAAGLGGAGLAGLTGLGARALVNDDDER